jgi:hypothetical protein
MTEIESPLTPWGKELKEFCQQNPQVAFNLPPQDQPEFVESLQGMEITEHRIGLNGMFFQNKPMLEFFQQLEAGDMMMMLVAAGKGEFLTIVARLEEFYKTDDIPVNARIDIRRTKTFKRVLGEYENIWLGGVVAATCVKNLMHEMCIRDDCGEIFREKALKHAVSPQDYHQLYPKLKMLDTGERVCELADGLIYEGPIFRVIEVSGQEYRAGDYKIVPGTRLTACTLNHINRANKNVNIEFIPRM